jgi:uncharacterized OB-fold protein
VTSGRIIDQAEASDRTYFPFPEGEWEGPIPVPDLDSEAYWAGIRAHEIRLLHCQACGHWVHYPVMACSRCHSFDLRPEPIVGTGTLYSFTISFRDFVPGVYPPYAIALVDIDEESGVRILSNLVNCYQDEIAIGMRLRPIFKDIDESTGLVFFEPDREEGGGR